MILGIISLVVWLLFRVIPLSGLRPLGEVSGLAISLPVAVIGLTLGIIVLVKFKPKKRIPVAGVVVCSLGIVASIGSWLLTEPISDWDASWSPDGSHIAFTSSRDRNWEIYVMDTDGSNQQRLTNDPAYDSAPSWSPDGSRIAFMSSGEGNWDIHVMDTDGSNQQRLTD